MDKKLFAVDDEEIQEKCNQVLNESADRIINHFRDQVIFDDKDVYEYFEPYVASFLSSHVSEEHNPHFSYTGSAPNFIRREQEFLNAQRTEDKKKAGYVSLMHSNTSSLNSKLPKQRTGGGMRGGLSSGGGANAKKASIKSISLTEVCCCIFEVYIEVFMEATL